MTGVKRKSSGIDGPQAEAELQALAQKYDLPLLKAAKRVHMGQSTYWRWKNGGASPMAWQVNLLTMSVLEMAEAAGRITPEDLERLNGFRVSPISSTGTLKLSEVRRLRAALAEAERLLIGDDL